MQRRIDRTARCCIERILYLDGRERQPEVWTHMSDIPAEQERQFSRYKGNLGVYNKASYYLLGSFFITFNIDAQRVDEKTRNI